jgi:hypothetical protein
MTGEDVEVGKLSPEFKPNKIDIGEEISSEISVTVESASSMGPSVSGAARIDKTTARKKIDDLH